MGDGRGSRVIGSRVAAPGPDARGHYIAGPVPVPSLWSKTPEGRTHERQPSIRGGLGIGRRVRAWSRARRGAAGRSRHLSTPRVLHRLARLRSRRGSSHGLLSRHRSDRLDPTPRYLSPHHSVGAARPVGGPHLVGRRGPPSRRRRPLYLRGLWTGRVRPDQRRADDRRYYAHGCSRPGAWPGRGDPRRVYGRVAISNDWVYVNSSLGRK
jgi:hypothetical protein